MRDEKRNESPTPARLNKEWHLAHLMPKNATMEQRIAWHAEHVEHCACRPIPEGVKKAMAEGNSIKDKG
jgi:hypothetical protein